MKPYEATHIRIGKNTLDDLRLIGSRSMTDNDVLKMLINEHNTNNSKPNSK